MNLASACKDAVVAVGGAVGKAVVAVAVGTSAAVVAVLKALWNGVGALLSALGAVAVAVGQAIANLPRQAGRGMHTCLIGVIACLPAPDADGGSRDSRQAASAAYRGGGRRR